MMKHEYKENNSTETRMPMTSSSSGSRLHYDARRVASEKNTMKTLDSKRESDIHSHDVVSFDTTTDMIAFQPKNRSAVPERTVESESYVRSDVEKNIDEAER